MSSLNSLILFSLFFTILSKSCEEYCGPNGCNCYKVFDVAKTAPFSEIKQTYRALSLKHHPDVSTEEDANAKFAEIADCYEILRDEGERVQYNQCLDYVHTDSSSSQRSRYQDSRQQKSRGYRDFYQQNTWNNGYQQNSQHNDFRQNTQDNGFRQNPRDDTYSNWSVIIPIITFILKMYFRGNEEQARPVTPQDGKKMLIGYGIFVGIVLVFLLLLFKAPFVLQHLFNAFLYTYELCGENIWNLMMAIFFCIFLVIKLISAISSFLGKRSTDNYFKNFFPDLRKKIDTFQQRIIKEINEKRRTESRENQEEYWNKLIESHLKTCKYYQNMVEEAEQDMKAR